VSLSSSIHCYMSSCYFVYPYSVCLLVCAVYCWIIVYILLKEASIKQIFVSINIFCQNMKLLACLFYLKTENYYKKNQQYACMFKLFMVVSSGFDTDIKVLKYSFIFKRIKLIWCIICLTCCFHQRFVFMKEDRWIVNDILRKVGG